MKTIPIALASHYAGKVHTLAQCLKVTRVDGEVYGLTSAPKDVIVSGVTYLANPGMQMANLTTSAGLAVTNTECMFLPDGVILTRADFVTGRWNNAAFELFELDYTSPSSGVNVIARGTLGEARPNRDGFVCELRGLTQHLQQPIGDVTQKTCRNQLGDANCGVDVEALRQEHMVTSVSSNQIFVASADVSPADYWKEGSVLWLTGANAGLEMKVRASSAGQFTLAVPALLAIEIGDTFDATPGCQKRLEEDCRDVYDNVLNFNGEAHLRGIDQLVAPVTPGEGNG